MPEQHAVKLNLQPNCTPGATIMPLAGGHWRLSIPVGRQHTYRLAQLDDYACLPRKKFPWQAPLSIQLEARVSSPNIPGTWGFGLWNDPFSLSLGVGGGVRRFPALPNTAWFFFASAENYLSFRDDQPAQGFLAQVFRAALQPPAPLLGLAALGFPLMLFTGLARRLRPVFRKMILENGDQLPESSTNWRHYQLEWTRNTVRFMVDGEIWEAAISPKGPLGFVIWIDNQFAAFRPDGKLAYGTLASPESAWLEVRSLRVTAGG